MKNWKQLLILPLFLGQFDTMTTASEGMSDEMKTYYDTELISQAGPELVHDQFGQQRDIPQGKGKEVEFRKVASLNKALTPLVEGVTPQGNSLNVTSITAKVNQYGDFIEMSDILELTTIDPIILESIDRLADQAGRTLDTVTREVLNGGTNVQYGQGEVMFRHQLKGGQEEEADNNYLSVLGVKSGVRLLKNQNARKINGKYVAIIHPNCTFDLTEDEAWKFPHQYVDTKELYSGEIGEVAGCRFAETTESKVFHAQDLASDARELAVSTAAESSTSVAFNGGTVAASALVGRYVLIGDGKYTVTANTASALTLDGAVTASVGTVIYPGEAGGEGRDVYSTLVLGADAYGVTKLAGGGLRQITKNLGSAGTADPLDQRSTVGWKATKTAVRLSEEYMVRIETCATHDLGEAN